MRRRLIAVPVILLAAIGFWLTRRSGERAEDALQASGTVEATDADLGFQIAGRVAAIAPAEGDAVSSGSELASLDTSELEAALAGSNARLSAARARLSEILRGTRSQEVAAAEAALAAAERRAAEAQTEAGRAQRLHEGGAISRQMLDQAITMEAVSAASRDQAREALGLLREGPTQEAIQVQQAVVEQSQANVARAEAALDHAHIRAPFSGVVTVRHREPGEIVPPGAPILTLMDPNDRWVRIFVREDQIGRVALGAEAAVASDSYPDRTYSGEVTFIGSEAEFTPRNVQTAEERVRLVYPVKIRITGDPDFELKPGIPADVVLEVSK
jgi:HlyD family secretion protein